MSPTASGPAAWRDTVTNLDQYAALSHKMPLDPRRGTSTGVAPTWVPAEDRRRLSAYKVLAAYMDNVARVFLRDATPDDIAECREYGDADLLVARIVAGVLGDAVTLTVDGAESPPPDLPDLPEEPAAPGENDPGIFARVHNIAHRRWEETCTQLVAEWEQAWADWPDRVALQDKLRRWAEIEQLTAKLTEAEHDAVGLGDGVYVLGWSATSGRARLEVYDPGFYFPVITDDTDDFPTRVHIAWEYAEADGSRWVRRKTWSLEPIDGGGTRHYPYAPAGELSSTTCYFTDASWPLDDVVERGLADLSPSSARFKVADDGAVADRIDLGYDFLPVVHQPNTPTGKERFGRSSLTAIAQLLDDISASDSDTRVGADLVGAPVLAMSGAKAEETTHVEPGMIYALGENGRMNALDLSAGVTALADLTDRLLERLSVNARVPAETLGRMSGTDTATSGLMVALRLGPFAQHIEALRLTRSSKHPLLLKMAARIMQVHGVLDPGVLPPIRLHLGSYLPNDLAELVSTVVSLLEAHAISRRTALAMLTAGGLTIDDAAAELDRIRAEDTEAAKNAGEATGSDQIGADWLGVELPPKPEPPTVTLPPPPGPTA